MDRNFKFDRLTIVLFEGKSFDLHNEYDLVELGTDLAGAEAVLTFVRNQYASPETPPRVRMTCRGHLRYAFQNLMAADLGAGFEIAYFCEGDPWEYLIFEDQARDSKVDGFHIDLGDRLILRIACDTAEFQVIEDLNVVVGPWRG